MELLAAAKLLATFGQKFRLSIFRLLLQVGNNGLFSNVIGEQLSTPPASPSFHLASMNRERKTGSSALGRLQRGGRTNCIPDQKLLSRPATC